MRSFSLLGVFALTAIWVGVAGAESTDGAPMPPVETEAAAEADVVAAADGDDPFAEFGGFEEEAEAALDEPDVAVEETEGAAIEADAAPSEPMDAAPQEEVESIDLEGAGTDAAPMADASAGDEWPVSEAEETASSEAAEPTRSHRITLGPIGVDEDGRQGRIHTVAGGDTLWHIADAYLGTPWVWPSIWHENDSAIANPHVIQPGDLIWITSSEMRRVTRGEADSLMATATDSEAPTETADAIVEPAETETVDPVTPGPAAIGTEMASIDLPAEIDPNAGADSGRALPNDATGSRIRVPTRENMSFVSSETIEAATSIVESPFGRTWLASGDVVIVGMGEGAVESGQQFTIFRDEEPVRDMDNDLLGYHIEVLGWLEVTEVHPESSVATIKTAVDEIVVSDRLVPREVPTNEVTLVPAPADLRGHVVHMPDSRTVMGDSDYVFLDRGSVHGLEVGSHLEVIAGGTVQREVVQRTKVQTPPLPLAELVVVSVRPDSSVAVVYRAKSEIERGARIRAITRELAHLD